MVIIRPGIVEVGTGPLLILAASSLWGVILVVMKALGRSDAPPTMVAYMVVFMTPMSLIPALLHWQWPTWEQLGLMAMTGLVGTAGHLTLTQALRLADTAVVVPIDFFKLIWAALFGYLFFSEVPDIFTWVGGVMIFAGAAYLAVRERSESQKVPGK
jgi:drug/metabolite transporter (DMT)-like permease